MQFHTILNSTLWDNTDVLAVLPALLVPVVLAVLAVLVSLVPVFAAVVVPVDRKSTRLTPVTL